MGFIGCVQGQGEGSRGPFILIPISEGIPQDILESFRVQGSQEDSQPLHLAPDWKQLTPLFSGEIREFLPAHLGNLDWSSRGRSLSGHLVESLVSGFVIHLRISLSETLSWGLWVLTGWRIALWLRWRVIWRLWMQISSVGTDTGLPLDPMVGLRILRDS